jgi:hypothetical protein
MANFVKAGGKIYVCSPCFKKRKLDETALIDGADRRWRQAGRVHGRRLPQPELLSTSARCTLPRPVSVAPGCGLASTTL